MRNFTVIALSSVILLLFLSCSPKEEMVQSQSPSKPSVSPEVINNLNAKEALALANKWKTSNPEITSFLESDKLTVKFPNNKTVEIPMPKESMIVALAPYINKTHDCEIHYLSGCQGELVDVPVKLLAVQEDGTVLIDQTMNTMSNGFIELWLPRDKIISLSMESMGKKVEGNIITFKNSNTCITTFQLL
jgi:hypothetical protein